MKTGVSGATWLISVQRRHAPLGELELGPAADDAHPLRRRGACACSLQHRQGVGERGHAVPAELHVVVEPAADDVEVGIVETRDDAPALEVDPLGRLLRAQEALPPRRPQPVLRRWKWPRPADAHHPGW